MMLLLRRLRVQIVADKRRFGMLCVALAVGLLLWARLIIVSRVPRTAVADEKPLLASGGGHLADVAQQPTVNNRQSPAKGQGSRTPLEVELSQAAARDPFVISPHYFPKPIQPQETDQPEQKSNVQPAEEPGQIEVRRTTQLTALAAALKLEAALGESLAVINGKRIRPGDGISMQDGSGQQAVFKLESIRQRSVILECEGRRYELHMAAPGD